MSFVGKYDDLNVDTLNVHRNTCFSNSVQFSNKCSGVVIEDADILNQPGYSVILDKLIGTTIKTKSGAGCVDLVGIPLLTYPDPNCNTFLGFQAGSPNTTGMGNTVFGCKSLNSNITGQYNSVLGVESAQYLDNCDNNIIVGYQTLYSASGNTRNNTFVGTYAGYGITSGDDNVVIGNCALGCEFPPVDVINGNVAVGFLALLDVHGSIGNTAIGHSSLDSLTVPTQYNTGIGYRTMKRTTGIGSPTDDNTVVGEFALYNLRRGSKNTYIGELTGNAGLLAANNTTCLGWEAVYRITESAVGIGFTCDSGDYSVNLGFAGGFLNIPRCVGIGYFSRPNTDGIKIGAEGFGFTNEISYVTFGTSYGVGSLSVLLGGFPIGVLPMRDTAFGFRAMKRFDELDDCVAFGYQASQLTNSEKRNVTLGANANAIGVNNSVVIGQGATAGHSDTIVLGNGASTSATNQMSVNGMTITGASSGASGNFLQVRLGGVAYKIPLHNP